MLTNFINKRANTRFKRISLVLFPFAVSVALFRLAEDLDDYGWEPSLSFILFFMASVLCLLFAFTSLGDWLEASIKNEEIIKKEKDKKKLERKERLAEEEIAINEYYRKKAENHPDNIQKKDWNYKLMK